MHLRTSALLVLVLLLSGCGGSTINSIRKMVPVALLVSLAGFSTLANARRTACPTRPET